MSEAMEDKYRNQMGEMIDELDNLAHALLLPMPAAFHVEQLKEALPKVVRILKKAYAGAFGEDPWEDQPQ